MKLKTQDYNDVTVIELQGELGGDFIDILKSTIELTVSKKRLGVVFDMTQVGFIDSKGLEHLLWTRDYCNDNSCAFKLAGLNEYCMKILEVTGLQKEFDKYSGLADAVKSFA